MQKVIKVKNHGVSLDKLKELQDAFEDNKIRSQVPKNRGKNDILKSKYSNKYPQKKNKQNVKSHNAYPSHKTRIEKINSISEPPAIVSLRKAFQGFLLSGVRAASISLSS